jgi:hypothetical protein
MVLAWCAGPLQWLISRLLSCVTAYAYSSGQLRINKQMCAFWYQITYAKKNLYSIRYIHEEEEEEKTHFSLLIDR